MKLFTKDIDKKLFAQFSKGPDLENQKVVAKIFNPYGRGRWYLLNSDPNDPDYLWAIVQMDDDIDIGSVSRRELENIKVPPFRLGLERDIYFSEVNADELFKGLFSGKLYKSGGQIDIAQQNKDMLLNYAEELEHHTEEFEEAAKKAENVEPWVVAKIERSTTDLSDVTHYLDSENEIRREYDNGEGEEMAKGGRLMTKGDAVIYDDETHFITEKNGVVGLVNMKQSASGSNFPFTPLSKIDVSKEVTDMYGEKVNIPTKFESGGMTKGEYGVDKNRVYFSSFAEVMDAINDIADENGYKVVDIFPDLSYGGVSYGQTKKAKVELEWNGQEKRGKSKKREKNTLNVQIYRMDSGNYELNTYFSYEKGGMMADGGEIFTYSDTMREYFNKTKKEWVREPLIIRKGQLVIYYHSPSASVEAKFLTKLGDKAKIEILNDYEPFTRRVEANYVSPMGRTQPANFLKNVPRGTIKTVSIDKIETDIELYYKYYVKPISQWLKSPEFKDEFSYLDNEMAMGGEIISKNNKTGETYSVVSGSIKKSDDDIEDGTSVNVRNRYSSRISESQILFDKYGNLYSIIEYGYTTDGTNPSNNSRSGRTYRADKKETLDVLSKKYSPVFAKKLIEVAKNYKSGGMMADGGKVKFADKVKSVKSSLLKRKKVSPKVQKDYGKTYSPAEAEDSAKRIVGSITAKERLMNRMKKSKK